MTTSEKTIKISADSSQARKEFAKLFADLQKQRKLGLKLDPSVEKIFNGEASKQLDALKRAMGGAEIRAAAAAKKAFGAEATEEDRAHFIKMSKRAREYRTQFNNLGGLAAGGQDVDASKSSTFKQMLGATGIMKYGITAATVGRGFQDYNAAMAANSDYLKLRGMGLTRDRAMGDIKTGVKLGYAPEETRNLMAETMRITGKYNPKLLNQIQGFSRAYGLDTSLLTNNASALYKSAGGAANVAKQQSEILASAIAAKLDRSKLADYLSTANALLENMSETSGVNTANLSAMLGMITGMGGTMTPQLAGRNISALDQALRSPNQQQAGVIYSSLAKTLAEGGYNGDLGMAMRLIQESGISGINTTNSNFPHLASAGKLGPFQDVFAAYDPTKFVKNIAENIDKFSKVNPLLGGLVANQYFKGGPVVGAEFIEATKNSPNMSKEESLKWISKMNTGQQTDLADVLQSTEGTTEELKALNKFNQEKIGAQMLPAVNKIKDVLLHFENSILGGPPMPTMMEFIKTETRDIFDRATPKRSTDNIWDKLMKTTGVRPSGWKNLVSVGTSAVGKPNYWQGAKGKAYAKINNNYDDIISSAAQQFDVDPLLVKAMMTQESAFDPNAESHAGAMGLMQLMPGTAKDEGVTDPFDPTQNIYGGVSYLKKQLIKYKGNVPLALAAYNAGPGAVDRAGGIPNNGETPNYVNKITQYYDQYKNQNKIMPSDISSLHH